MRGKAKTPRSTPPAAGDVTAGLGDRDLAEVLLRLPSPASLARAALVCRRWRRVARSPAFLRLFRRVHPPPLLGFFVCRGGLLVRRVGDEVTGEVVDPTFLPVAPPPPGVGGAIARCRGFSLRGLPDIDHWVLADARDGVLLLSSVKLIEGVHLPVPLLLII
ncbi:hypothetical protein ACP70R_032784 [Stipagrostis hirtigluma subsp. patula]